MAKLIALRKIELHAELDADAFAEEGARFLVEFAERIEQFCKDNGLPSQQSITVKAKPSDAMLALLASGGAFRIEHDFKAIVGDEP